MHGVSVAWTAPHAYVQCHPVIPSFRHHAADAPNHLYTDMGPSRHPRLVPAEGRARSLCQSQTRHSGRLPPWLPHAGPCDPGTNQSCPPAPPGRGCRTTTANKHAGEPGPATKWSSRGWRGAHETGGQRHPDHRRGSAGGSHRMGQYPDSILCHLGWMLEWLRPFSTSGTAWVEPHRTISHPETGSGNGRHTASEGK